MVVGCLSGSGHTVDERNRLDEVGELPLARDRLTLMTPIACGEPVVYLVVGEERHEQQATRIALVLAARDQDLLRGSACYLARMGRDLRSRHEDDAESEAAGKRKGKRFAPVGELKYESRKRATDQTAYVTAHRYPRGGKADHQV